MAKYYTIDEVSKMFGIPKSTLRYWDSINLFDTQRNDDNSYRLYSRDNIIELCNISVYKNFGLSLSEIKKIHLLNLEDMETSLIKNERMIQEQIVSLNQSLININNRLNSIRIFKELSNAPYHISTPDFKKIVNVHPSSPEYINNFIQSQNKLAFVLGPNVTTIKEYGIIDSNYEGNKVLWEDKGEASKFLVCTIKVGQNNILDYNQIKDYYSNIKYIHKKDGVIIGQYLFSSYEEETLDHYKLWIELV